MQFIGSNRAQIWFEKLRDVEMTSMAWRLCSSCFVATCSVELICTAAVDFLTETSSENSKSLADSCGSMRADGSLDVYTGDFTASSSTGGRDAAGTS